MTCIGHCGLIELHHLLFSAADLDEVLVQVEFNWLWLSADTVETNTFDFPLNSLVIPSHVHELLLGLVVCKFLQYIVSKLFSLFLCVLLPS